MLSASATLSAGGAHYRASIALERRFRLYAIEHRGAVWDSRFDPGGRRRGPPPARGVYLLLDGWIRWDDAALGTLRAPAAFVAAQEGLDGFSGPRAFARAVGGEPYRALQIVELDPRGGRRASTRPEVVAAPPAVFEHARSVLDGPPSGRVDAVARQLDACAAAGLVAPHLGRSIAATEDELVQRLWDAATALVTEIGDVPSLKAVADRSGLSTRQLLRAVLALRSTFRLPWLGWRDLALELRLRRAILMLSVAELPIAEVAAITGYGSNDALALALRRAGLPPARDIRAMVRAGTAPG